MSLIRIQIWGHFTSYFQVGRIAEVAPMRCQNNRENSVICSFMQGAYSSWQISNYNKYFLSLLGASTLDSKKSTIKLSCISLRMSSSRTAFFCRVKLSFLASIRACNKFSSNFDSSNGNETYIRLLSSDNVGWKATISIIWTTVYLCKAKQISMLVRNFQRIFDPSNITSSSDLSWNFFVTIGPCVTTNSWASGTVSDFPLFTDCWFLGRRCSCFEDSGDCNLALLIWNTNALRYTNRFLFHHLKEFRPVWPPLNIT